MNPSGAKEIIADDLSKAGWSWDWGSAASPVPHKWIDYDFGTLLLSPI